MVIGNNSVDVNDRFCALEAENAEIRRKLALHDASNDAI